MTRDWGLLSGCRYDEGCVLTPHFRYDKLLGFRDVEGCVLPLDFRMKGGVLRHSFSGIPRGYSATQVLE